MFTSTLHKVDTASKDNIDTLARLLRPHIPYSLPVLGSLFSGDIEYKALTIWTTFPLNTAPDNTEPPNHDVPSIYSVVCHSLLHDHQFRFFCSAETTPTGDPTAEDTHVFKTIGHLLSDKENGVPSEAWADGVTLKPGGVLEIGHLNERWISCLQPYIQQDFLCTAFVRPPRKNPPPIAWNTSPHPDWEVSELRESDVAFVQGRLGHFPRSYECIRSRLPYSVCIRRKNSDDQTPVAWNLILADGATGMLYVEADMRRKGLARMCKIALSRKMEEMFATEDPEKKDLYPHARWEFNVVYHENEASMRLSQSLEGWKELVKHHWIWIRN
ncbi:hypothetical protein QCA50_005531 [Cerrena zonata]|uniref:Glycine N-acyltransferase-like protein n=1 Tax=Cerrena zonata TaxID=2478898 RepID=A0AAW0GAI3_9APHY